MNKSSYIKGENTLLYYKYREAKVTSGKPKLLLLLHGVGSNEDHLYSFANEFPEDYLVISARAPYENSPGSYRWFAVDFSSGAPKIIAEEAEKSRIILIQFLNQLKELHDFDSNEIYIGGFSQGSIMSFSLGLTHPEKVKGVIGLSGRILKEIRPFVKVKPALENLNVLLIHGKNDQMLSINFAREAKEYLEELGVKLTYHETEAQHTVTDETIEIVNHWLERLRFEV